MPYIDKKQRSTAAECPLTPGELNYAITRLLDFYIAEKGADYTQMNAAMGAVESAKQEFYRRVVVPYEEHKRRVNGDVYTVAK